MKLSINIKDIFICIILLAIYKFFFMFNMSYPILNLAASQKQTLVIILSLLFLFSYPLFHDGKIIKKWFWSRENKLVLIVFVFFIIEVIYSVCKYSGQTISGTVLSGLYLLSYILIPTFGLYTSYNINNTKKLCTLVTFFSASWATILVIQEILYKVVGVLFLDSSLYTNDLGNLIIRNSNVRMGENATLLALCMVVSFSCIINKKGIGRLLEHEKLHLYNFCVSMIAVIVVIQTRMIVILCLMSIVAGLFTLKNNSKTKILLVLSMLVITTFFALSNSDFLTSILYFEKAETSYINRVQAYSYYWNYIKENPILGMGIISGEDSHAVAILRGPYGRYFTSDIGLYGTIARYGIFPAIIYFSAIIKSFKLYKKYRDSLFIVISVFLIMSCLTLSSFEAGHAIVLPLSFFYMYQFPRMLDLERNAI